MKRTATVAIATLMGVTGFAANAQATTGYQVYSGTGWRLWAASQIHSLAPHAYTVQFASTAARTHLTPYVKATFAQIQSITGIKFTVSTTVKPTTKTCAGTSQYTITYGYEFEPIGKVGSSHGYPCVNSTDHSAWGGWVEIDNEYWSNSHWFSTNATKNASMIKNAITHETGHVIGLDHPNVRDANGNDILNDCPLTPKGYRPVMCDPNGGYYSAADGGKFTSIETPGLVQLAKNYYLPEPQ